MKYFLSEPWYVLNEFLSNSIGVEEDIKGLKSNGFILKRNFISNELCLKLIKSFKKHKNHTGVWRDPENSDTRIFGVENLEPSFGEVFVDNVLNKIYSYYIGKKQNSLILCNHLLPKKGNLGSGGGWHRDSMNRRQLKFIIYLTDTNEESGCFQYIAKSHRVIQKFKLNLSLGKPLSEFRYSEKEISNLEKVGLKKINLTGKMGDLIIVDTSGIHRGRPIIKGERFAITKYMWDSKIPSSNKSLIVKK